MFASGQRRTATPLSKPEKIGRGYLSGFLVIHEAYYAFGLQANLSCKHVVKLRGEY